MQIQKLNVRCRPKDVVEVIAALTPDQCDYVCRKSFGPLLDITVVNLETRGLLDWLLENTNRMDMIIRAGPGKNLEITKDVIHQILGLPNAGGLPEKIDWAEAVAEAVAFKSRLGLRPRSFGVDKMKQHIEKCGANSVSMRCFFLIVFNRLLFCKGSFDITNDHIYWTRQIEQFGDFDWCQLIYNDLCNAVRMWHSRDKNQVTTTVYGCCLVILVSLVKATRLTWFDSNTFELYQIGHLYQGIYLQMTNNFGTFHIF